MDKILLNFITLIFSKFPDLTEQDSQRKTLLFTHELVRMLVAVFVKLHNRPGGKNVVQLSNFDFNILPVVLFYCF